MFKLRSLCFRIEREIRTRKLKFADYLSHPLVRHLKVAKFLPLPFPILLESGRAASLIQSSVIVKQGTVREFHPKGVPVASRISERGDRRLGLNIMHSLGPGFFACALDKGKSENCSGISLWRCFEGVGCCILFRRNRCFHFVFPGQKKSILISSSSPLRIQRHYP